MAVYYQVTMQIQFFNFNNVPQNKLLTKHISTRGSLHRQWEMETTPLLVLTTDAAGEPSPSSQTEIHSVM